MHTRTVILLCISVSVIIGQPIQDDVSDTAGDPFQFATQGVEMMSDIMKLIMSAGNPVMATEGTIQRSEEKSPEILIVINTKPENLPGEPAAKPETSPTMEETRLLSPPTESTVTFPSNGRPSVRMWWFTFGMELLRNLMNLPNVQNTLENGSMTELGESLKEYMRTVDEGSLAIKYDMVDSMEKIASLLRAPMLNMMSKVTL